MPGPGSREWLEAQVAEYTRLHPAYRGLCEVLEAFLKRAADRHAPLAILQTRAKKVPSFAEKCLRKQAEHVTPAHQLTDLCGARLIARTASELRAVSGYIEEHLEVDWENSADVSERLNWDEFGYRSIHYIVSLRRDPELGDVDEDLYGFWCELPECPQTGTFHPLKAEIQVRTLAEHAWADFAHDITYKGAFTLPEHWLREVALMAADLEDVDRTVERIETGLRPYAASYGAFLEPAQLAKEVKTLETVLEYDPNNAKLAWRIGKLAMTTGDWARAVELMDPFVDPEWPEDAYQPLLRDLGVSLGKHGDVERGRRYLEAAAEADPTDSDAIASLAGTWRGKDDLRARDLYRRAFEVDPTDYYPLLNYVECEIERTGTTRALEMLGPMAAPAMARCQAHIDVGMNMPWAVSSMAKFHLLLGDPYAALDWYCHAIRSSIAAFAIPSLERTRAVADQIPGHEWSDRLLTLARVTFDDDDVAHGALNAMTTPDAPPIRAPVLIITGTTDSRYREQIEGFRPVIAEALAGFHGTVVSGGTEQGICGIVGEVAEAAGTRLHAVGYVPASVSGDVRIDARYDEVRSTSGDDFSPLEALQYWADVIASGIDPSDVMMIGIGGGDIAAAEYRVALALGAHVGIIEGSGRAGSRLLADPRWASVSGLVGLPADPHTARAFVARPAPVLEEPGREALAQELHRAYCEEITAARAQDPAQRSWAELSDDLKQSNLSQVDAIVGKVEAIGCSVRPAADVAVSFTFTDDEVEYLAEMEHGRWTAERLRSGWRWAPQRDAEAKVSPHLVPWAQLPEDIRQYDREFVERIPGMLATVGLEIVREG